MGNKTDCSVLQFVLEYGDTYQPWRDDFPEDQHIKRYDFTAERKFMATVIREKGLYRMYVKGAPEILLEQCVSVDMGTEEHKEFGKIEKEQLLNEVIDPMQSEGFRTLCLAYKDFPAEGKRLFKLNQISHCQNNQINLCQNNLLKNQFLKELQEVLRIMIYK